MLTDAEMGLLLLIALQYVLFIIFFLWVAKLAHEIVRLDVMFAKMWRSRGDEGTRQRRGFT